MKLKIQLPFLLILLLILTGCTRTADKGGYVLSTADALYKGDLTAYADMTGISTAEASAYRDRWLDDTADYFISAMGSGTPSADMKDRIISLLKKIYANAQYDLQSDDNDTVLLSVKPMNILTANYENLKAYAEDFNKKNDAFSFAALSEEAYYDTYLDGVLTILESHLAQLSYNEPVQITIQLTKDEDGLYDLTPASLEQMQNAILPWPESESEKTDETNSQ